MKQFGVIQVNQKKNVNTFMGVPLGYNFKVSTCSPSLSMHFWNFPKMIKKSKYFNASIFIRKAEMILWRPPGGKFL